MRPTLLLLCLASLLPPARAAAQANPAGAFRDTAALAARLDALVLPYERLGMFNGVILVAEGDRVVLARPYGKASYGLDVPLTADTRFRVASLSKQFTNAAIGVLLDRGAIALTTPVSAFLPDFPRGKELTVERLVGHTAGVPHPNALPQLEGVTRMTLDSMVALLARQPLDFEPGTEERYSNGGYDLLAAIIRGASHMDYEEFLQRAVLDSLGLAHTGRLHTYDVVPGLAEGYVPGSRPGERSLARFYPAELRIGGGSLYSSATDVFRLFRATFQRQFAALTAPELLFWDATRSYEITGRSPGFVAKVFIDIPHDITIVSLANNYSALAQWGRRLYQAAIGDPWETAELRTVERPIGGDRAAWYDGTYASRWDRGTIAVDREGQLGYFDVENDWRVVLVPLADDRWLHPFFDLVCRFEGGARAEALVCRSTVTRFTDETRFARVQ